MATRYAFVLAAAVAAGVGVVVKDFMGIHPSIHRFIHIPLRNRGFVWRAPTTASPSARSLRYWSWRREATVPWGADRALRASWKGRV